MQLVHHLLQLLLLVLRIDEFLFFRLDDRLNLILLLLLLLELVEELGVLLDDYLWLGSRRVIRRLHHWGAFHSHSVG